MNAEFKHKLFNYSEAPPGTAWEGIAAALDEQPDYARKLQQYQPTPPADAWNKIAQHLDAPKAAVLPLRTKLFKYAIAVAVLGLIAAGSLLYMQSNTGPNLANGPQQAPSTDITKEALLETKEQTGFAETDNEMSSDNNADVTDENGTESKAVVQFASRVRIAMRNPDAQPADITPKAKNVIDIELPNRYMIATTAGGKAVRLPKKAYSAYACADAYTDASCRERIASIQNKMAASVATDFTEFVDLLKKLQEN